MIKDKKSEKFPDNSGEIPYVEIIVVEVHGSAPREAGARMRWFPGGKIDGTIGGGNLEQQCIEEAEALWSDPEKKTALLEFPLSAKLGQCCGGHVRVYLDKRLPRSCVLICGAGHVSTIDLDTFDLWKLVDRSTLKSDGWVHWVLGYLLTLQICVVLEQKFYVFTAAAKEASPS